MKTSLALVLSVLACGCEMQATAPAPQTASQTTVVASTDTRMTPPPRRPAGDLSADVSIHSEPVGVAPNAPPARISQATLDREQEMSDAAAYGMAGQPTATIDSTHSIAWTVDARHGRLHLRELDPTVSGNMEMDVVRRVVRRNFGKFRTCYEDGLTRNNGLHGRLVVQFTIKRDGTTDGIVDHGSTLDDRPALECMLRALAGMTFPEPKLEGLSVVFPIEFGVEPSPGSP